jgi:hypothetical protein
MELVKMSQFHCPGAREGVFSRYSDRKDPTFKFNLLGWENVPYKIG